MWINVLDEIQLSFLDGTLPSCMGKGFWIWCSPYCGNPTSTWKVTLENHRNHQDCKEYSLILFHGRRIDWNCTFPFESMNRRLECDPHFNMEGEWTIFECWLVCLQFPSWSLSVSLCPLPLGKNGFFMSDVRACKSRIKTEPELNLQDQPRTLLKFRSEFFCIQGVRFLLSTPPPIPSK